MARRLPVLIACAALVPTAAVARDRALWATINVCDTIAHPDTIGIRGSMPGTGDAQQQMFMRFRVQFFQASTQRWHNIPKGGDSKFQALGPANVKARQSGWRFIFAPPAGGSWQMRGAVTYEWRTGDHVDRREKLLTSAGHRSGAGSDPAGYSAETCVIS